MIANGSDSLEDKAWQRVLDDSTLTELAEVRPAALGLGLDHELLGQAMVKASLGLTAAGAPARRRQKSRGEARRAICDYLSRRGVRINEARVHLFKHRAAAIDAWRKDSRAQVHHRLSSFIDATTTDQTVIFVQALHIEPREIERRALLRATENGKLLVDESHLDFRSPPELYGRSSFARVEAPTLAVLGDLGGILGIEELQAAWLITPAETALQDDTEELSLTQSVLPELLEHADEAQVTLSERLHLNLKAMRHRLRASAIGTDVAGFSLLLSLHEPALPALLQLADDLEIRADQGPRSDQVQTSLIAEPEAFDQALAWFAARAPSLS